MRGRVHNQWEHHIILTKYEAVHPMAISENYSLSGMLIILIKVQTLYGTKIKLENKR